ncbi:hypothetical protein [Methylobacterium dankookense]|uniref:Uncharacterized protein n=1 Tax=Methylobacterium dankookense TaxID=560405 RepID=A0A564G8Z7_9HYPH|nr:hypothetical protein [Methylobacterium dankookense]GJD59297.1 hypothetical protein IFDJLNFL_5225 [Methylobacterium dankookense]VUF16021.1 hypothetical protein MTDSW087_05770 [Methylobacterium dankookense]
MTFGVSFDPYSGKGGHVPVYDPDPIINERIRRAVRYGQTRWAEIWLSWIALSVGIVLLGPTNTFSAPSFRVIASVVSETTAGSLCVFFGALRLLALWINGRRGRETSLIRTFGCLGGFAFWLAIAVGFLMAAPPVVTGVAVYSVLAIAELHASGRAASDMAAEDTFGIRARRRRNGGSTGSSSAT